MIFAGAIALVATVGLTAPAITRTRSENFKFNYDSAYGHKGLSRPYTGPTTTGQRLRHRRGDRPERPQPEGLHPGGGQPKHGGRRSPGRLSGKQPHDTAQLHTCHLRSSWGRTPSCAAPATARSTPPLGANGYVGAFTNSSDSGYQFQGLLPHLWVNPDCPTGPQRWRLAGSRSLFARPDGGLE